MKIKEIKDLLASSPNEDVLTRISNDERIGVQKLLAAYYKKQASYVAEQERFANLLKYEQELRAQGYKIIAGVDEAGRGPLAGPLVVGTVILPENVFIEGLDDSKKLSAKKRNELYNKIMDVALGVAVSIVSVADIDKYNIYRATKRSMEKITEYLTWAPDAILIDAMPVDITNTKTISLIHGDALSASIAAASIIAKVTRDNIMEHIHMEYPQYGFQNNKGYGSKEHIEAITRHGITPWHRHSFEPIKSMAEACANCQVDNKSETTKLK